MLDKNKNKPEPPKVMPFIQFDPKECPFREFKDTELSFDYWGMGPAALRTALILSKMMPKVSPDQLWVDEQTQPLPRSVRQYIHSWVRAEDLAMTRWGAEVAIFDETNGGKMSVADIQLSHAQVLMRSSFCRMALSACYILEKLENITVEHQWDNFNFSYGTEGWRARFHIYSPGTKSGGGPQHRPGLSKNGCYLVRLFYLGLWRCVWVNDLVPVDATESPLLPFSLIQTLRPPPQPAAKETKDAAKIPAPPHVTPIVLLWPLLICKALLKLAAPDMSSDEDGDGDGWKEDEVIPEFSIWHALTGCMQMTYDTLDHDRVWTLLTAEVPAFTWDEDDETVGSTVKSKATKKPNTKEVAGIRQRSMAVILLGDTKNEPVYALPGITPAHEVMLLITMTRDVPIKKPLPEPEVSPWKHIRWVEWARKHSLYEDYDCPRTKFLKVTGLLKQSYAPHLLQVTSTESIVPGYRQIHESTAAYTKNKKEVVKPPLPVDVQKEELRDWVLYDVATSLSKQVSVVYFPSTFQYASASSMPPIRITKTPTKTPEVPAPKTKPLYLQIDNSEESILYISLSVLHPRLLSNAGYPVLKHYGPSHMVLEKFEWFDDCELPKAKGFIEANGYGTTQVSFIPGRHFCRIWVNSLLTWNLMLISESSLHLGPRDSVMTAAVHECPWACKFLNNLGNSFSTWIRLNRVNINVIAADREFYRSYPPDLTWDEEVVGYEKPLLHWMFRKALQSRLSKILHINPMDRLAINNILRYFFCDPDFGLPDKSKPPESLRKIIASDPCDCTYPEEVEEVIERSYDIEGEQEPSEDEKPVIDSITLQKLIQPPPPGIPSIVCELATEETPCEILKEEREKLIQKHEAATYLQALWRGTRARKCLKMNVVIAPDVLKLLMDNVFGNQESLSALMNEFFLLYPGAKYAFSIASGLGGAYSMRQFFGSSTVSPICKWIPFFQGIFICHAPVKVHLDINSSLRESTVLIYNNDTLELLPHGYSTHVTFDIEPNVKGYSVMGHGSLKEPSGAQMDASWQLTVLCSKDKAFHICDNNILDGCKESTLFNARKIHIDEVFVPNEENILGGIQISVTDKEYISFRAAAVSPELEIQAILKSKVTNSADAEMEVITRCSGIGELFWPYIKLEPDSFTSPLKGNSTSQMLINPNRSAKSMKQSGSSRLKIQGKNKERKVVVQQKIYVIDVIAPKGWPMTLEQWKRVDEARNKHEVKYPTATKIIQASKEKPSTAKDKGVKLPPPPSLPHADDPYIELECSLSSNSSNFAYRDDTREQTFRLATLNWEVKEPGRNQRGAKLREEFRQEFLVPTAPEPKSANSVVDEFAGDEMYEEDNTEVTTRVAPSPTEDINYSAHEVSIETVEEFTFLKRPECLKEKFIPLDYVPFCTKEIEEESVLMTPEKAEEAKRAREAWKVAALQRMRELQKHNESQILDRQKTRGKLFEYLFLDGSWKPEITRVLEERDDAIAQEALARTISASKKKQDQKKK